MQQDKNDMENKLRQLENQQLPDLSRMDEHWDAVKTALQPGHAKGDKSNKWIWLSGLLILAVTGILLLNQKKVVKNDEPALKQEVRIAVTNPDVKIADTVTTSAKPTGNLQVSKMRKVSAPMRVVQKESSENLTDTTVISLPVQLNSKDSTLKAVNPDAQKTLNQLLCSLAKKAQEFIIDNSRDTILFAAEGSSLLIPAKSLGGNRVVKISLREFYKTSDIVMNKLSTTSNGEQLITGGMVHISATANEKPVDVVPGKTIRWYLPDTSRQMEEMQLFKGEERKVGDINWINTGQGFSWPRNNIVVKVLDLRNEPFKTKERRQGLIGYFSIVDEPQLPVEKLKELYREKYGYYKVRFRKEWRKTRVSRTKLVDGITYSDTPVGDSAWIRKDLADKYKLPSTQSGIGQDFSFTWGRSGMVNVLKTSIRRLKVSKSRSADTLDNITSEFKDASIELERKYSVNINSLGWINCDRFYNDPREKINYYVDLQDSAINYFTMMIFDEMRSMMTGSISRNQVHFTNVPVGEPVKIISIGVDKKGEVIMAMKETKISKETLIGLQFESISASSIKSTLRKEDN